MTKVRLLKDLEKMLKSSIRMHAKSVLFEDIIPGDVSTIFQSIWTASSAGFNQ